MAAQPRERDTTVPIAIAGVTVEERLTSAEMEYHRTVLAQLEGTQAAFNSWAAHLNRKYRLGPVDTLDNATGVITRPVMPPAPDGAAGEG